MIDVADFGEHEGQKVRAFTLTNRNGLRAKLIEFGATLTEMHVPDRQGRLADIVLGFDDLAGYVATDTYFGALCGRYGNRIDHGRFSLDGRPYQITLNEGAHVVHGGRKGFDKKLWRGEARADGRSVRFTLRSPDGEEGFPGTLDMAAVFTLSDDDRLEIAMTATTDRPTVCNLVHHSYWNLAGHDSGDVLGQLVEFPADFYTPVDAELIPTGEIRSVEGTAYDFTAAKPIGRDLARIDNAGGGRSSDTSAGYDHNWVLRGWPGEMKLACRAVDPASGRGFTLHTTEPGVQFYISGYLDERVVGKGRRPCRRYGGFTLETQKFPDSPNLGHFPSARLDPGQTYRHVMSFKFGGEG